MLVVRVIGRDVFYMHSIVNVLCPLQARKSRHNVRLKGHFTQIRKRFPGVPLVVYSHTDSLGFAW